MLKFQEHKNYLSNQDELFTVKRIIKGRITLESPRTIKTLAIETNESGSEFVKLDFGIGNHILAAGGVR